MELQLSTHNDELFSRITRSELLYGREWLASDLRRLITLYYHINQPDTSTLFSTINQLKYVLKTDAKSTFRFPTWFTNRWIAGGTDGWWLYDEPNAVRCHSAACLVLVALEFGLYEFWTTENLDSCLRGAALHLVTSSMEDHWFGKLGGPVHCPRPPPFDRLLRSLAICLADGTTANSHMLIYETFVTVSRWQNLVWHSIVTTTDYSASVAPVWLLYLLHGADRTFTLNFEQSCNFSSVDRGAKLVIVTGRWGQDQHQVHSPIHIREEDDDCGILELAKRQKSSISLKEIACFWFPAYADSFRGIFDLYENDIDIPMESLKDLRRDLGVDPEFWQSRTWDDPRPLLRCRWEGDSQILRRSGEVVCIDEDP